MPRNGDSGNLPSAASGAGGRREVIFEFSPIGGSVKVTAVDVATGTEVSVVGPATASQNELERIALQKLRYRLGRDAEGQPPRRTEPPRDGGTGGGILV